MLYNNGTGSIVIFLRLLLHLIQQPLSFSLRLFSQPPPTFNLNKYYKNHSDNKAEYCKNGIDRNWVAFQYPLSQSIKPGL